MRRATGIPLRAPASGAAGAADVEPSSNPPRRPAGAGESAVRRLSSAPTPTGAGALARAPVGQVRAASTLYDIHCLQRILRPKRSTGPGWIARSGRAIHRLSVQCGGCASLMLDWRRAARW
jgi:hypothetical protein